MFVYYKKDCQKAIYEDVGQISIFGYYPKQVRKILYGLQKKVRENTDGYRDKLKIKNNTISKSRAWNYKRLNGWI